MHATDRRSIHRSSTRRDPVTVAGTVELEVTVPLSLSLFLSTHSQGPLAAPECSLVCAASHASIWGSTPSLSRYVQCFVFSACLFLFLRTTYGTIVREESVGEERNAVIFYVAYHPSELLAVYSTAITQYGTISSKGT
ncbi:unnamed protein product [Ixodes pacificus]